MTKYDDFDYHAGEAQRSGQPADQGFTRLGFMLAWLLRHGLGNSSFFGADVARDLGSGRLRPNDLRDLVDGKLMSDMLTAEGAAFLDAYYLGGYLNDYETEFADVPRYGVPDDPDHEARIEPVIDRAHARWVGAGRPEAVSPDAVWSLPVSKGGIPDVDGLMASFDVASRIHVVRVDEIPRPHVDSNLEQKIADAIRTPVDTWSCGPNTWGSSTLNRALRELRVNAGDVVVVNAMGLVKGDPLIQVYKVPTVGRADLTEALWPSSANSGREVWTNLAIDGFPASGSTTRPAANEPPWTSVRCAIDGFAVSASSCLGEAAVVEMVTALMIALKE